MKTKFFNDIERLRGFACILVFVQHFALICPMYYIYKIVPDLLLKGVGGVHIFFAISGFVITLSLKNKIAPLDGKIFLDKLFCAREMLALFYKRRFFRVFPVAFFVVVVFGVFLNCTENDLSWFPALFRSFLEMFFGVYNNSAQQFLISETIHIKGLGPFWTLAVESQFYVWWPIIMLLCKNNSARAIVSLFLGMSFMLVIQPLSNVFFGPKYYLAHSNLSELFLGSFLAFLYEENYSFAASKKVKAMSAILVMIVWCYPSLSDEYFSGITLSLSSVLVVALAVFADNSFNIPVLGKFFDYLGSRSYSFYAIQLTIGNIIVWYTNSIYFPKEMFSGYEFLLYQFTIFIVVLAITSELVYRFIEKPCRECTHK